jgi:hypothetical protein
VQPGLVAVAAISSISHTNRSDYEAFMATQDVPFSYITEAMVPKYRAYDREKYVLPQYLTISNEFGPFYAQMLQNMDFSLIPGG